MKSKKTRLEKYGDENYSNHDKAAKTYKNRSQEVKDEQKRSFKRKCIEHFGVDHPMKCPEIRRKAIISRVVFRYRIDGHSFDSFPEFCFYVCCRDFGIDIQCHPIDKVISYVDAKGNMRLYCPDFYLPNMNRLVEIKGDHFFENRDPTKPLRQVFGKDDGSHKN